MSQRQDLSGDTGGGVVYSISDNQAVTGFFSQLSSSLVKGVVYLIYTTTSGRENGMRAAVVGLIRLIHGIEGGLSK